MLSPHTPLWKAVILPEDGIESVIDFIRSARLSICCKYFKLIDPQVIEELIAAHRRQVDVRVMLNAARSDGSRVNDDTFASLSAAGLAVRWTNPRFVVSHEKSIIVDNSKVLIATFNVCPSCLTRVRDYGVITDDKAVVTEVAAAFAADWDREDFAAEKPSRLLWSSGNSRERMAAFIDAARKTLDIQHPKLVDAVILDRLLAAHRRGVKLRLLCGGSAGISDWDIRECFAAWRIAGRSGIKVRQQKSPKLHAKLMVADGLRALVSSFNIDRSSFDLRRELGVVIDDLDAVERLHRQFNLDWSAAKKYSAPDPLGARRKKTGLAELTGIFRHE